MPALVRVFVILNDRSSFDHPLGDAFETFLRREDAERFVEDVRGDDPELASHMRIAERELEAADGTSRPASLHISLATTHSTRPCDERYVHNVAGANDARIDCTYLRLMTSHKGRGIR